MVKRFDHLTIAVRDLESARRFFGLLGFKEAVSVVITGEPFASYMGLPEIEADHVTLVLENATPRTEIQLLHYRHPQSIPDPHIRDLHKIGLNHVCFATDDLDAELRKRTDSTRAAISWISTRASLSFSTAPRAWWSSSRSGTRPVRFWET